MGVSKNEAMKRGKRSSAIGRARYQCFIDSVAWTLKKQAHGVKPFTGAVKVELKVSCPKLMDHHNLVDPVMDAIQRSGVVENDRKAIDIHALRVGDSGMTRLLITIQEA